MSLPDAEKLLLRLADGMRPQVGKDTQLVGIHTGGVWLAERLNRILELARPIGMIDVSFYRDDYESRGLHPSVKSSQMPFSVDDADVVLVDDVLFTGRTIRAALNVLFDYGRPRRVRLAALIDRGGRELPVAAQFVGAELSVGDNEQIDLVRDEAGRLDLKVVMRDAGERR